MATSQSLGVDARIMQHISCDNNEGDTLLHWAIRNQAVSMTQNLLENGTITSLPNDQGQTPLHLAISTKDLAACKLLVEAGANLHVRDKQDKSPVDLAMSMLLDDHSADDSILDLLVLQGTESVSGRHQSEWFRSFCFAISTCQSVPIDVFLRHGWSFLDRNPATGGTTLHFVITLTENLAPLQRLIREGVEVNAVDGKGVTVLHIAAQRRNVDYIRCLIKHRATVDVVDRGPGGTPLTGAIFGANVDNARSLLKAGASPSHKLKSGRPLLHLAAQQGQLEILELIVAAGVSVSILDEIGETAAYWACQNGHLNCIEFLITEGLDLTVKAGNGQTDLMKEAIQKGHTHVVEALLKHGLPITESCLYHLHGSEDIDPSRWEMLHLILRHLQPYQTDEDEIEIEAENKADMNMKKARSNVAFLTTERCLSFGFLHLAAGLIEAGRSPGHLDDKARARLLFTCAQHGFVTGARALLDTTSSSSLNEVRKFYVEPQGWRALEIAACEDEVELVKLFLERGWDPNREDALGRTSLHLAALCGASDAVEQLLGECNIDHRDKERNTPVHLGAYRGSVQVLELLHAAGADINKQNKGGETPLGIACKQGHAEVVQWLLKHGSRNEVGDGAPQLYPLHNAARHNRVGCMDLLIASGAADVDARCAGGNAPLHTAAMTGAWEAISRLLQAGADPNRVNHQGMTPLAIALSHADKSPDTAIITELVQKTKVEWDAPLSQNIIFTSCVGGDKNAIAAVFDRLKQERPQAAKKTVRRLLPELIAELCSSSTSRTTSSAAFPFFLEYMHSSSKQVLSTTLLMEAIRAGDDAGLAQALVDIDPTNAYLRTPGLWTMLHFACRYGRIKIARVLLANGAPAWAESERGVSPLEVARKYLTGEMLKKFDNLFIAYEGAFDVLSEDEEAQHEILVEELVQQEE